MCLCVYMCVGVCVYVCVCPWRLEEDIRFPGAVVTSSCEHPDVSAGNWTLVC